MAKGEGRSAGMGRHKKAETMALRSQLSKLDDLAFKKLKSGMTAGNPAMMKLFFEYRFGKPHEKIDVTSDDEKLTGIVVRVLHGKGDSD